MLILFAGCARTPEGSSVTARRELSFRITFAAPINDSYFYFVPIDTSGGGLGPTPVFPGVAIGEGWVTGSADYYVEYHQRKYTVYKITNLQPLQSESKGSPVRGTLPEIGGSTLAFTIDLDSIQATGQSLDVNFIAIDQPFDSNRLLDALGIGGTDLINLDITIDRTITNTDLGPLEPRNDVLDQDRTMQPENDFTKPLDIVDFSITTDV
jgi:hypothetical protein